MKRFLAVLAALCFVLPLLIQARVVTETEAFTVAEKLISMENQMPQLRLTQGQLYFKALEPLICKGEMVGYIVQLEPQGFMLISALTEQTPQKFVCFSGNFDEVKDYPFLIYVMDQLLYDKVQLNYCLNQSLVQEYCPLAEAADVNQMFKNESNWISLLSSEQALYDSYYSVGPLISIYIPFGQGYPWNIFTPMLSGQHTLLGCSAVAQTQVQVYWNWPRSGTGSNSYSWNGTTLYANFDHEYNWWPDTEPSGGVHSANCYHGQMGRLMYEVGISINMAYGYNSKTNTYSYNNPSGAGLNANNSLQTFFDYSPKIQHVFRKSYSSWDDWFNLITEDLDTNHPGLQKGVNIKGWPVLLAIAKPDSAHAVVVDGYRTTPSNQVHVLMGWDGANDNWYSMNNIYGYGDASLDEAVIGIRPRSEIPTVEITYPKDGEAVHGERVMVSANVSDDYNELKDVEFYVDGNFKSKGSWGYQNSCYFVWDSMQVNNGKHSIKAIAYDNEDQASLPAEISVNVKNVVINLAAVRKIESAWLVKRHYAEISFTASNEGYSIHQYEIYRKEGSGEYQLIKTFADWTSPLAFSMSYKDKYLEKGKNYTYLIKAYYEQGGLCGKSGEITI